MSLLAADDPGPVIVQNPGAGSPHLLVCDHAGRAIPRRLGDLGLPASAFELHIAWDIGALALAQGVAQRMGASLVHQAYSRLVIDCNRAPGHAQSIATLSDGVPIPGNQGLTPREIAARQREIHQPYHRAIAAELDARVARGALPMLSCIHSFTPQMQGFARPWHVGVLHLEGSMVSDRLLALLRVEEGLVVGDNEPYAMDGQDYTAPTHAVARGLDVLEIEVRQDLLTDAGWRERLTELFARLIPAAWEAAPPAAFVR